MDGESRAQKLSDELEQKELEATQARLKREAESERRNHLWSEIYQSGTRKPADWLKALVKYGNEVCNDPELQQRWIGLEDDDSDRSIAIDMVLAAINNDRDAVDNLVCDNWSNTGWREVFRHDPLYTLIEGDRNVERMLSICFLQMGQKTTVVGVTLLDVVKVLYPNDSHDDHKQIRNDWTNNYGQQLTSLGKSTSRGSPRIYRPSGILEQLEKKGVITIEQKTNVLPSLSRVEKKYRIKPDKEKQSG